MDDTIVSAFAEVFCRPDALVTQSTTLAESGKDYWGFGEEPGLLLRPVNRDEVVAIVKAAASNKVSLVMRGGGSNCSASPYATARSAWRSSLPTAVPLHASEAKT